MGEKLNFVGGGGGGRGIGGMEVDVLGFDVGMRVKGDICKFKIYVSIKGI